MSEAARIQTHAVHPRVHIVNCSSMTVRGLPIASSKFHAQCLTCITLQKALSSPMN